MSSQPPPLTDSWYVVIGLPFGLAPAYVTVTRPVSGVAPVAVVGPGGPAGTTGFDAPLAAPAPTSLIAVTRERVGLAVGQAADGRRRGTAADARAPAAAVIDAVAADRAALVVRRRPRHVGRAVGARRRHGARRVRHAARRDRRRRPRPRPPVGAVASAHEELLRLAVGQVGPRQPGPRRRVGGAGAGELHLVLDDRVAAVAARAPADADELVAALADRRRRGVGRPQRVLRCRRRAPLAGTLGVHGADHERVLLAVGQPSQRYDVVAPTCTMADAPPPIWRS